MNSLLKNVIYLIIVTGLAWLYASYKMKGMPFVRDIQPSSLLEPKQEETTKENFIFTYDDIEYVAQPLYDYQVNGVVVSHSDISSLFDNYRVGKNIHIKDLCITWGDNLKNTAFRKMKFWNRAWSCLYDFGEYKKYSQNFNGNNLSNNHLVADRPYVLKKIDRVKVGDQVSISGYLINYFPKGASEKSNNTSVSRSDSGDDAREIIYVDNLSIIEPGKQTWSTLNSAFKSLFFSLLALQVILTFFALVVKSEEKK